MHSDQLVPERHPGPTLAGQSVEEILADCEKSVTARGLTSRDRVLSTASWERSTDLIIGLLAVMPVGASLVQVANPDPAILQRRIKTEKVTQIL